MATVSVSVVAQNDDDFSFRLGSSAPFHSLTSEHIGVGYSSSAYYAGGSGLRFTGVSIPAGATITTAYITVIASISYTNTTVNSDLCCENSNNPNQIADSADHIGRTRTTGTACIAWDNIPGWTAGDSKQSPSIVAAVQKVVDDNAGTGDALIVFWEDKDGESTQNNTTVRYAASYDNVTYVAPALYIEYTPAVAGWAGGDVSGVALASIGKISGIAIADIGKVSGV